MAIGTGAPNDTRKIGPNRNHITFNIPSLIGISYLIPCSSSFFNLSFQSPISNFTWLLSIFLNFPHQFNHYQIPHGLFLRQYRFKQWFKGSTGN